LLRISSIVISLCLLMSVTDVNAEKLQVVTEASMPLQYLANEKVSGPATELVEMLLVEAGFEYEINLMPWARSYQKALTQANTLIYSITRTQQREDKFHWIGEITPVEYKLYKLAKNKLLTISEMNQLNQYKVGVIRGSATEQILKQYKVKYLVPVSSGEQVFELAKLERIDFFPANHLHFRDVCKSYNDQCELFEPTISIPNAGNSLYIAISKSTAPEIVNKLQKAYIQLKQNGTHDIWQKLNEIR